MVSSSNSASSSRCSRYSGLSFGVIGGMSTSAEELKTRLLSFLDDPQTEEEFHDWFSHVFRNVHLSGNQEFEDMVRRVQVVFVESALGTLSGEEAFETLSNLAKPTAFAVLTPNQEVQFLGKSPSTGTPREVVPNEKDSEGRFVAWHLQRPLPAR